MWVIPGAFTCMQAIVKLEMRFGELQGIKKRIGQDVSCKKNCAHCGGCCLLRRPGSFLEATAPIALVGQMHPTLESPRVNQTESAHVMHVKRSIPLHCASCIVHIVRRSHHIVANQKHADWHRETILGQRPISHVTLATITTLE